VAARVVFVKAQITARAVADQGQSATSLSNREKSSKKSKKVIFAERTQMRNSVRSEKLQ
jgi:hypothetical protein